MRSILILLIFSSLIVHGQSRSSGSSGGSGSGITALTGDVTASGTGSVAATIATGAVTDAKSSLANKPSVGVVATTNQTLSGTPTIDGIATATNTLILATAQTAPAENGPWLAAAGAWSRPAWYPSGGTTQAFQFISTFVRLGTTYAGTMWRQTAAAPITIDTTGTTWAVVPFAVNSSTIAGIVPVANGGSGTSTAFTSGSVIFSDGSGVYTQDNANFFWDDTNNFLGLGVAAPTGRLHIVGNNSGTPAATGSLLRLALSTFTDNATAGSGTATNYTGGSIGLLTLAATNSTVTTTNAVSLLVNGPVAAGTNETISNSFGIRVLTAAVNPTGTVTTAFGLSVAAPTGAGSNYAAVFTGGNVGIGTSAPAAVLDVAGTIVARTYLQSGGTSGGLDGRLYAITSGGTTNTFLPAVGSSYILGGSVGIGITSPSVKLQADGGNATATYAKFTAGTTTGVTATDGFSVGVSSAGVAELRQYENLDMTIYTNNTLRMTVNAAGHLVFSGTAPSITANCGTSPSIAGNDIVGRITVGTGGTATNCTITFAAAYGTAPVCIVGDETTSLLLTGVSSTTTLSITAGTPLGAADKLVYQCEGY